MPEPVTHLTVTAVIGRHSVREYLPLFLLSTLTPDIDGLLAFIYIFMTNPWNTTWAEGARIYTLFHPSFSASLFFVPFFALVVLGGFRLYKPDWTPTSFRKGYLIVLSAILIHLGLDMLMTGNRPFWPLPLEAGLGIIPYTRLGAILPPVIGLTLLTLDLLIFRKPVKNAKPD
jgi:membrane-bound metal-dependent hydrolase YbcI (DUF457 family)